MCDHVEATGVLGYAWIMLMVLHRKILSPSRATLLSGPFKAHLGVQCGHLVCSAAILEPCWATF